MTALSRFGLAVDLPPGWEGSIFKREPSPGEQTHPVLHAASFPMPPDRGDYGNGAVNRMAARDVFLALLEDDPSSAGAPMYTGRSQPRSLSIEQFNPATLQRDIPGQAGTQVFFSEGGRAFCLYAVLGSWALARLLVARLNPVVATLRVDAR